MLTLAAPPDVFDLLTGKGKMITYWIGKPKHNLPALDELTLEVPLKDTGES